MKDMFLIKGIYMSIKKIRLKEDAEVPSLLPLLPGELTVWQSVVANGRSISQKRL